MQGCTSGPLRKAWAGQKSFRRKDEGDGSKGGGDFHGEPRSNQTHAASTDPEARLYKKSAGQEAKLSYLEHTLVENRNGLIAAAMTTQADGRAERDAALLMLHELTRGRSGRITTGADKAYDTRDFVSTVRELGVTPHVARRQNRAIDERTSRHPGYAISVSKRWLVEKPFGWLKQIGPLKKVKLCGLAKVDWLFVFNCAAFNLLRIPKLRALHSMNSNALCIEALPAVAQAADMTLEDNTQNQPRIHSELTDIALTLDLEPLIDQSEIGKNSDNHYSAACRKPP